MFLGVCLRVLSICLLFGAGSCFPTARFNGNSTSLSSETSANPEPLFTPLFAGNESAFSIKTHENTPDSNSTSAPDILLPRSFYVDPTSESDGLLQPQLDSGPQDLYPSHSPRFGPPIFHEPVYTGPETHLYTVGDGSMRFPYYGYNGVHAAVQPYGYTYGAVGSPLYSHAYGTGGSPSHGYAYGTGEPSRQAHQRNAHVSRPHGMSPPPAYGYFPWQPTVLDPEVILIGNIVMKLREIPHVRAWRTSEVPVGLIEKPLLYPSSLLMQSNGGHHQERDPSNGPYSKNDYLRPTPELETPEMQHQDVTETDY